MLKIARLAYKNLFVRLTFLVVLLMAIFSYQNGHFIFVQAFNNQVIIFPGFYGVEQAENSLRWQNIEKAFFQDLSGQAEFADFNRDNSAYIIYPDWPEPDKAAQPVVDEAEKSDAMPADLPAVQPPLYPDEPVNVNETEPAAPPAVNAEPDNLTPDNSPPAETPAGIDPAADPALPTMNLPAPADESAEVSFGQAVGQKLKNLIFGREYKRIFNFKFARAQDLSRAESGPGAIDPPDQAQEPELTPSIIFSDFSLPVQYAEDGLSDMSLVLSFGARSGNAGDRIIIAAGINGDWEEAGAIELDDSGQAANNGHGDYFRFSLPAPIKAGDIDDLKIKATYSRRADSGASDIKPVAIYLDAIWLEVNYQDAALTDALLDTDEGEVLGVEETAPEPVTASSENGAISLLSARTDFQNSEIPEFNFRYERVKTGFLNKLWSGMLDLFSDEYKNLRITAKFKGREQAGGFPGFAVRYDQDGEFTVRLPAALRQFQPGRHQVEITVVDNDNLITAVQDFRWGVLAFNRDNSVYRPGETAYLQLASLDDTGHTLCDSDLELMITAPGGETTVLSVAAGTIKQSDTCGADNVTDIPDYYAYYRVAAAGDYQVKLTNRDNGYAVNTSLLCAAERPFSVARAGATRINPFRAGYVMRLTVTAQDDFSGWLKEAVPAVFRVGEFSDNGRFETGNEFEQIIAWPVELKAGQSRELQYTYFAPKISPQFYLLGPLIASDGTAAVFYEERQWQIAADDQQAFTSNGTFVVPLGVDSVTVKAWGGGGGGGGGGRDAGATGGGGGGGGFAQGTMSVTAGESLTIRVGGSGGGGNDDGDSGEGGGGGGYSAVLRNTTVLVQAGGGGGGGGAAGTATEDGGGGGGGSGANGANGSIGLDAGCPNEVGDYGDGGTTGAGGAGGTGCSSETGGQAGAANQGGGGGDGDGATTGGSSIGLGGTNGGGRGGDADSASQDTGGGGGGGGQYGGGGGEAGNGEGGGGGGGGSGKTDGLTNVVTSAGTTGTSGGAGGAAAYNGDADYAGAAGAGGTGNSNADGTGGNAGRIVVIYTVHHVVASTTGAQTSVLGIPSADNYVGGAFVLAEMTSTSTITGITLTENGTVNAQTGLSNIRLYYDLDASAPYNCASESFAASDTRFGATSTSARLQPCAYTRFWM